MLLYMTSTLKILRHRPSVCFKPISYSFHFGFSTCVAHLSSEMRDCRIVKSEKNQQTEDFSYFRKRNNLFSRVKSCQCRVRLLKIHAHLIRTGFVECPSFSRLFLSRAAELYSQDLDYLCRIFSQFSEPDVSLYNILIKAFSLSKFVEKGMDYYLRMLRGGVVPDAVTMMFFLRCCCKISVLAEGLQVHSMILRCGYLSDNLLMTSLMDFYSICGTYADALKLFSEIPHTDTVAYNVLISCLVRNSRAQDALRVFDALQCSNSQCDPDDVTCLLLLPACATLGSLDFGKRIHSLIKERRYDKAVNLCNALISMYSELGCMEEAYEVFSKISNKNVVSWTAIIYALAINGHGRDAIEAFWEMQRVGIAPDAHTFTGVLRACSCSGLVEEGIQFFELMTKEFHIVPSIHHYGCMVDLLGRAGLLDQAYDAIISMRGKPDVKIWRTLLRACRAYRHYDLAEHVIQQLVEVKAQEAGDYVLLLNIYSSVGNWEGVTKLRQYMKDNQIQPKHGCSAIELKGTVHELNTDDASHPQKNAIYDMLKEIEQQLKISGYVSEMSLELDNIRVGDNVITVPYHSEKLALAMAVLMTDPGITIRVAKNGQICVDCHNFAKVFSAVYNRKVIIIDTANFHHFRHGYCSCNDCW